MTLEQKAQTLLDAALRLEPHRRGLIGTLGYEMPSLKTFGCASEGTNIILTQPMGAGAEAVRRIHLKGERNLVIVDSFLKGHVNVDIAGDDNLVVICQARVAKLTVGMVGDQRAVYTGPDAKLHSGNLVLGEGSTPTSIIVGRQCMFSKDIAIRATDSHAVIDIHTRSVINEPASILVEPYVWLGEGASILKGSVVGFGSIVASLGLVSGNLPPRSACGGVPAKVLRQDVTWSYKSHPSTKQIEERLNDLAAFESAKTSRASG